MKSAVFDTNVLVSGFLSPYGPTGHIVDWLRETHVQAVLDDRIRQEYVEVLVRPKFDLPAHEVRLVLAAIATHARFVVATQYPTNLPDPDDAPFLECAWAGDVALVTGNTRHFPRSVVRGVKVLTPAQFVAAVMEGG